MSISLRDQFAMAAMPSLMMLGRTEDKVAEDIVIQDGKVELLATHHILQDGQICLFRSDTKPNQKLVNGTWVDLYRDANVASWASRINQKPVVRNTVKIKPSPIYPRKNVLGAYQGD